MQEVTKDMLKAAVKAVWIRSLTELQPDVLEALISARAREKNLRGQKHLIYSSKMQRWRRKQVL